MKEASRIERFPASPLECREDNGQLTLYLPARPDRGLTRIAGSALVITGVFVVGLWYGKATGLNLLAPFLAVLGFIVFLFVLAYYGALHWTKTFIIVTPQSMVVKTILLGKEEIERHTLTESSQAWRLKGRNSAGRYRRTGGGSVMQWVEIKAKKGQSRFGYGLSKDEADWVVSRINQFLGRPIDPAAPTPYG